MTAKNNVCEELEKLYADLQDSVSENDAQIISAQKMIIEDEGFISSVAAFIESEKINAEYAVRKTVEKYEALFKSLDDEYIMARSADIKDVSELIIEFLTGGKSDCEDGVTEPVIIVADELSPAKLLQFDRDKIAGIVTVNGSAVSHTSILARSFGIPSVINADSDIRNHTGSMCIVDGNEGTVIIDPDDFAIKKFEEKKEEAVREAEHLKELINMDDVTSDGRRINLYANINELSDVENVVRNNASGIGLFRTEFMILSEGRHLDYEGEYLDEEKQYSIYRDVLEKMKGRKVIIRTFDLRDDKSVNDAMHCDEQDSGKLSETDRIRMLKTQLKALYRASEYGSLSIMYPMVSSVEELSKIKELSAAVREELSGANIPFVEEGIMIETAAAVRNCEELAKHVDFFSIGTNDLTREMSSADSGSTGGCSNLKALANTEALMNMIKKVTDAAHKAGIWAGVCGELAADTSLTSELINAGADELSVNVESILSVRKAIRNT